MRSASAACCAARSFVPDLLEDPRPEPRGSRAKTPRVSLEHRPQVGTAGEVGAVVVDRVHRVPGQQRAAAQGDQVVEPLERSWPNEPRHPPGFAPKDADL